MNPVEEQLPPPPHRISNSCHRHPDESFTGFCPSCLYERLAVLDQSSSSSTAATTAGRKSASSAIKSLFRGSAAANGERPTFRTRPGSFLPELRRTKSFSGDGALGFTGIFEPQRKSCDVRVRSGNRAVAPNSANDAASAAAASSSADQVQGKLNHSDGIVIELKEEEESEQGVVFQQEQVLVGRVQREQANSCEIQEIIEENIASNNSSSNPNLCSEEQLGDKLEGEKVDSKPMKDHIDLDSQNKKPAGGKDFKDFAGSFWSAASGFSKKLRSWTRKNSKLKKHNGGGVVLAGKKSNAARSYRETQSEIADYGYGRRSCDTDPRFSIDAGRVSLDYGRMSLDYGRMSVDAGRFSVDDPRYSLDDEPRASWDGNGNLIGGGGGRPANISRMNPMVSLVEDPASVMVLREDNQIPLDEEPRKSTNEEEGMLGGAMQTKVYYLDSSSSRRKSLDRSNSIRKTAATAVAEMGQMESVPCNAKVTPTSVDYWRSCSTKGMAGLGIDRELRDSISSSLRDDYSENFDVGFRDSGKKSRSWRPWNIWDLIVKRGGTNKDEDDDRYSRRVNGVERSYSESLQELGRDPSGAFNRNVLRSNSSVSWRNSNSNSCSMRKNNSVETNGHAKKKSNEFVLERNKSARYAPSHAENGILRFYLTPLRGSKRGATLKPKPPAYSQAIA